MTWLRGERNELAVDRILDAAAALFAEHGLTGIGMDEIARAAGCSRATLYRYFESRRALQDAFARREALMIMEEVAAEVRDLPPGVDRGAETILAVLRAVRSRPDLKAWYAAGDIGVLHEIVRGSTVIEALVLGDQERVGDQDLAHWVLRLILSFLSVPGADEEEERRLISRFLSPVVTSSPTASADSVGGRT
jgi:AcrR family transcriptional regulator